MSTTPENDSTRSRDDAAEAAREAAEAGPTPDAQETQQIEVPAGRAPQFGSSEQSAAGGPAAGHPTEHPTVPLTGFGAPSSGAWGNPGPSQPTPGYPASGYSTPNYAAPNNAAPRPADPFALLGTYPTETVTSAEAPVPPSASTKRGWTAVVGAAAAAALVASLATVGLTVGFGDDGNTASPTSIATIGQSSNDTSPVTGSTSDNPSWEQVAAAVSGSVVAIQVTTANGGGEGSGVVIDAEGHVLTNNHVVEGAQNDTVQITLSDGRLYEATIVGTDPTTDLAVVKITDAPSDLEPAALGDSDSVVVGESVMAVGNPLGLANTVTTGIVSAIDRPVSASAEASGETVVTNAIQIDAAINPGNSGGPLFDAEGRVIGITSSIATLSGSNAASGSIGLGFAIPIALAQNIASQLVESGTAEHAFLGVSLSDGNATADGTTRKGAVVQAVTEGSPASEAGIQEGDVIVAIDDNPVAGAESLTAYVRERMAGSETVLTLVRDGDALEQDVTLAARATPVDSSSDSSGDGSSEEDPENGDGGPGLGQNPPNPFDEFFGGRQG